MQHSARDGDAGRAGGDAPLLDQASAGALLLDRPFGSGTLDALRAAVAARAAGVGLSQDRADDLVVAMHELAANAVLHGAGHGRLCLWRDGQALHCRVTDDGPRRTSGPAPANPPGWVPAPWPIEQGHGLWLVREVADEISLRCGPGGSVVTIGFALGGPA